MKKEKKTIIKKPKLFKLNKTKGSEYIRPPFETLFWIALAIGIVNILFVFLVRSKLPPEAPLYYGLAEGSEQLSQNIGLVIPGAISIGIALINYLVAILTKNEFLQKIIFTSAFCVSCLSIITVIKIVFLVGSF